MFSNETVKVGNYTLVEKYSKAKDKNYVLVYHGKQKIGKYLSIRHALYHKNDWFEHSI